MKKEEFVFGALQFIKILWALPWTAFGCCLGLLGRATGGGCRREGCIVEFWGGTLRWILRYIPLAGGASAITFGHSILARSEYDADEAREHELVHVRQYERWGPLFIPAYLMASAWCVMRGRSAYWDNPFEQEAYGRAPHPPGQGPLVVWGNCFAWLLAFACGGGYLASYLAGYAWYWDLASHFQHYYVLGGLTAAMVLWISGRFRSAIAIALLACWPLGPLLPLFVTAPPLPGPADAANTIVLRIVSFNVLRSSDNRDGVLRWLESVHPDIVLAQEIDLEWVRALSPLRARLPYGLEQPRTDNFGMLLMSRYPAERTAAFLAPGARVPFLAARILVAQRSLDVVGVHLLPPIGSDHWEARNRDMDAIAQWVDSNCDTESVIVAGDFNCTTESPFLRHFLRRTSLRDSRDGQGMQNSWPTHRFSGRIAIDHLFHSESLQVRRRFLGPRLGSDHLPVVVDIAFSAGTDS